MRTLVKAAALTALALVLIGGALYQFVGLRIVLDGSGSPGLRFAESPASQAERIARDRAQQRDAATTATAAGPSGSSPHHPGNSTPPSDAGARTPSDRATPSTLPGNTEDLALRPDAAPGAMPPDAPAWGWTDFRGPLRDGRYRGGAIFTDWSTAGLKPVWRQPVGGGYASFSIARGRAFTIEQRGPQEVVAAYDVATGRELWTNGWDAEFREFMGGDGPRATPSWSDGRVYALGALGELRCLDETTGRVLWRKNILEDNGAPNLEWAMAAAPLIVDDTVIVQPGGPSGRSVVAYDRRTGERRWSALDDKQAYASPMLATLAGRRQLLVVSASRIVGLTPDAGDLLWEHPWVTQYDVNAAQPMVVDDRRVLISSGYGKGAALLELSPDGNGLAVRSVWTSNRLKSRFNSSVLYEGHVYGFDEAILACIDANTGEQKWKGGRYGYGQLILADGHLIVLTEDGDLALVRATPTRHEEVARFAVLDGKTWNHPALDNGRLLVRNLKEMAAFDLRIR
jgi:outer membrane protein assembly factor BamB